MVLFTYIVSAALALLASPAVAAPTEDWKTLRGWNGVVSSPESIGVPIDTIAARLISRAVNKSIFYVSAYVPHYIYLFRRTPLVESSFVMERTSPALAVTLFSP